MLQRYYIFIVSLGGYLALSCNQVSTKTSAGSNSQLQDAQSKTKSGTKISSGDLGSLEALLKGLTGGGGGAGGLPGGESGMGGSGQDPNAIYWDSHFEKPFMSFQIYEFQKNYLTFANVSSGLDPSRYSDVYDCPGDSFLVGFRGVYSTSKTDRSMQPYCQFFEDASGAPLKKQNCGLSAGAIPPGRQAPNVFSCPKGKFLAGFRGSWDSTKNDRAYEFECCEMSTQAGVKAVFKEAPDLVTGITGPVCERYPGSPVAQVNHLFEVLNFQCQGATIDPQMGQQAPAGTVLHQINTTFMQQNSANDRIWSFECCAVGLPSVSTSTGVQAE